MKGTLFGDLPEEKGNKESQIEQMRLSALDLARLRWLINFDLAEDIKVSTATGD